MNVDEHSMSHIHLTKDDIIGSHNWKGDIDLLNIVLLGLCLLYTSMVRDVNETVVSEKDILSYSVYHYDKENGITIAA